VSSPPPSLLLLLLQLSPLLTQLRSLIPSSTHKLELEKAQLSFDLELFRKLEETLNLCESWGLKCEEEKKREKNVRESLFQQREKVNLVYQELIAE